jgi:hypothetical protein
MVTPAILAAFGRRRLEKAVDAEVRFHLEARAADLMREGLNSKGASRVEPMEALRHE